MTTKSERINLRVSPEDLALIDAAAGEDGVDRSTFILNLAVTEAKMRIRDRVVITLDPDSWDELTRMLDRPPRHLPELEQLFRDYPP